MKKVYPERSRRGFTLVELLVVMAIMGILAGIVAINYQGYMKSARDGRRKTDLEQIRSALEMFRADCGKYWTGTRFSGEQLLGTSGQGCPTDAVGNVYINLPADPLTTQKYYYISASGTSYSLCATLEKVTAPAPTNCPGTIDCGATCNYEVTNP